MFTVSTREGRTLFDTTDKAVIGLGVTCPPPPFFLLVQKENQQIGTLPPTVPTTQLVLLPQRTPCPIAPLPSPCSFCSQRDMRLLLPLSTRPECLNENN